MKNAYLLLYEGIDEEKTEAIREQLKTVETIEEPKVDTQRIKEERESKQKQKEAQALKNTAKKPKKKKKAPNNRINRQQALQILSQVHKINEKRETEPEIVEYTYTPKEERNYTAEYIHRNTLTIPKYDKKAQTEQEYFVKRLYFDNHESETIIIQQLKDNQVITKHCRKDQINETIERHFKVDAENVHIIPTSFIFKKGNRKRNTSNAHMINALFIDLDIYKKGLTVDEALAKVVEITEENNLPQPTFKINSGGGIYLLYKITAIANNSPKIKALYTLILKSLYELYEPAGADFKAAEIVRMMKIPGTINGKYENKPTVDFIDDPDYNRIELYDFKHIIKPQTFKKAEKVVDKAENTPQRQRGLNTGKTPESLYEARKHDLLKVDSLRTGATGHRYFVLFYTSHILASLNKTDGEIMKELNSINQQLRKPLDQEEVERINYRRESAYNNGKWKFTNKEIIEKIGITEEEQQHLKTLIGKTEKDKRRKEQNRKYHSKKPEVMKKRTAKEKRDTLILKLKEQGHTQKEALLMINEDYNIKTSIATIKRKWNQ